MVVKRARKDNQIRVAIIGLGFMGQNHLRIFSQIKNVKVIAASDTNDKILKQISARYPIKVYANYLKMLLDEDIDVVSIAVPTTYHFDVAKEVIRNRKHLLIEKPIAINVDQAEKMIDLAKRNNLILGVGHIERFNPVITELKKRINVNKAGKVFQVMIRRIGPYPQRVQDIGVFLDLAIHDIDILNYLIESDIDRISSESSYVINQNHEDLAISLLRFKNKVLGLIVENWVSPTKIRDIIINCEKGMYIADFITQDLFYYKNDYSHGSWATLQAIRGMTEGNMVRYLIKREEPLKLEIEAFINSVVNKTPFLASGAEGLKSVIIACRLKKQANKKSL